MLVKAENYIHPSCWFVINIWYLPNKWVAVFRPEGRWELKPLSSNEHFTVPSAAMDMEVFRGAVALGHMVILRPLKSANSLHLSKSGPFFIQHVDDWGWNGSFLTVSQYWKFDGSIYWLVLSSSLDTHSLTPNCFLDTYIVPSAKDAQMEGDIPVFDARCFWV